MGFALVLRELLRHRLLLVLGVLVAAAVAVLSVYRLEGTQLKPRALQHSSASTQVIVDAQPSVLGNVAQSFEPLDARAAVYANFMTNPAVINLIGKQVGLSGAQIYAAGPVTAYTRVEQEPTALKRNVEITGETKPYRLDFESQTNLPTITINSQAPTTSLAIALANAAAVGMQRYVTAAEISSGTPHRLRVTIRQLGPANGAVVDGGIRKSLAAMAFVAVLLLWCVLILVASRFREIWRESAALQRGPDARSEMSDQGGSGRHEGGREASGAAPHGGHTRGPEGARFDTPSFDAPSELDDDGTGVPARSHQW
jgi:hypothetical protein